MTIQNYGYNFNTTLNSIPLNEDSSPCEKNNPLLFKINQEPLIAPQPPMPKLQEREITIKKEQDFDSIIVEEEGFEEVKVKQEPGLELPISKKLLSISTIKERIKLINANFDYDLEIGVENCLACCISFYNWILSGADFPEAVDPYAKPLHEHMVPQKRHQSSRLQDPFLEKLHNPKKVNVLEGVSKIKEYVCLTEDLPLTFNSVKLVNLKTKIESSSVPWQQYEKGGKTFKLGILFLNHRDDETKAHFLAFEYRKTSSKSYTLYIHDPQSANVLTYAQFLKDYKYSYADEIKIWSGQNKINYDCNQTVEEMFKAIKTEQEEKILSSSNQEQQVKAGHKRKHEDDAELGTSSKQKHNNNSPKPMEDSPWARIAKMTRSNSLNTIDLTVEDFVDESWEKDILETPPTKVPKSTANWLENRNKAEEIPQVVTPIVNIRKEMEANSVILESDNNAMDKTVSDYSGHNSTIENQKDIQDFSFLFDNLSEAQEDSFLQRGLSDPLFILKQSADLGDAKAQFILGNLYQSGREGVLINLISAFKYYKLAADQGLPQAQCSVGVFYIKGGEGIQKDLSLGFKYFKLAADQGLPQAQCSLGILYSERGIQKDLSLSFKYFKLAADQGFAYAQCCMGTIYHCGIGNVLKDIEISLKYYHLAADQGLPQAQFDLGIYYQCQGIHKDLSLSFKYFKLAADQGHRDAEYKLGRLYLQGIAVPWDQLLGFEYLKLAADKGLPQAQCYLGILYLKGDEGVQKDLFLSFKYLKLAADQGYANALLHIGNIYFTGLGNIAQNRELSFKYYELAAVKGLPEANYNLGVYYQCEGIHKDLSVSFKYFKLAADQGFREAEYKLGQLYLKGIAVPKDLIIGFRYLKLAADKGHIKAQHDLGKLYIQGTDSVSQDLNLAFDYIKRAADQGSAEAQFDLGVMYMEGRGCQVNFEESMNYCELAANQGLLEAQLYVGKIHTYKKNLKAAFKYYKLAADRSNPFALYTLGTMYHTGRGVPKDIVSAEKCYQTAALLGNVLAKKKLEQISNLKIRKHF